MLVKIKFNNKERLVILEKIEFNEFLAKTKNILELRNEILVEYSGCKIDETLFLQLLAECARTKEAITFTINCDQEVDHEMAQEESVAQEIAGEPEPPSEPQQKQNEVTEGEPAPKRPREATVNHRIAAMKFEEIFEVAKLIGALKNGHILSKSDRISAAKAVIKKILSELDFDYK